MFKSYRIYLAVHLFTIGPIQAISPFFLYCFQNDIPEDKNLYSIIIFSYVNFNQRVIVRTLIILGTFWNQNANHKSGKITKTQALNFQMSWDPLRCQSFWIHTYIEESRKIQNYQCWNIRSNNSECRTKRLLVIYGIYKTFSREKFNSLV